MERKPVPHACRTTADSACKILCLRLVLLQETVRTQEEMLVLEAGNFC